MSHGFNRGGISPDSSWSWLVACGNTMTGVVTYGMFRSTAVYFHPIMDEFGVDYGDVSLITALVAVGTAFGALLPLLTRKYGSRITGIGSGIALGFSGFISSLSPSLAVIQTFYGFISGIMAGALVYIMLLTSNQYFDKHRSKAVGVAIMGIPLGTVILPPIIDTLIQLYGWRGSLMIMSAVMLHSCVTSALYRPVNWSGHQDISTTEAVLGDEKVGLDVASVNGSPVSTIQDEREVQQKQNWRRLISAFHWRLFRKLDFVAMILAATTYYPAITGFGFFLVPLATDRLGTSSLDASLLLALSGAGDCIGKLAFGVLGDLNWINRSLLVLMCTLLCGIFCVIMTFFDTYITVAVFAFTTGILGACYLGLNSIVYRDIVGLKELPHALSFHGFLNTVFMFPVLYILGISVDNTGDARVPFYICSSLFICTAVFFIPVYVMERRRRRIVKIPDSENRTKPVADEVAIPPPTELVQQTMPLCDGDGDEIILSSNLCNSK